MPARLERRQQTGDLHFITCSCYKRLPYLTSDVAASVFERALEHHWLQYGFLVVGYVIMPEHVHFMISEPPTHPLSTVLGVLKRSVSRQLPESPFWLARYHDRNIWSDTERVEKLRYMHRNPVARGLVESPEQYRWSSFNAYLSGLRGCVQVETGFHFD